MNPTGTNGWTLSPRGVLQRVTSLVVVALLLAVVLPAGASRLVGAQSQDGATAAMGSRQAEKAPAAEQGSAPDSLQPRAPAGDQAGGAASPDAADALDNRSGGPDGFGYTFDDNESHPAHGRQWQDISGTGEVLAQGDIDVGGIAGGGLDDGYWQISFPFPFKFYGSDRNGDDLFISTNGFVTFDSSGANSFSNVPIPDGNNDPEDAVYAFWDDLTAGTSALTCGANPGDLDCGIYWQVVGSAPNRRLIVQWNEVPFVADADAGHVTFQIQLLEATGEIRVEYLDPQDCALDDCERGSGGEATIAIEADDGTTGLQYSFNEPALMSKPGTFIQNVVFHPPHLEVTKNCFAPETELHNAPAGGTAEVVLAGQQWICRIQVTNHGSFPVPNVQVTDAIPANTRLLYSGRPSVPAVPVAGAADVTFDVGIVPGNDSVSWELGFIVDADYLIQPPLPYPAEDEICNDAMITNPMTLAYSPSREQDRDCDVVKDRADLRVSKLVEPFTSVRAGDIFTYTIYVDNLGPSAARNVTITDTLLSSANVSIQSCAFSVSQGGGAITQFTCTTGNLVSTQFGTDVGTFRTSFLEPLTPTSQGRIRASFRLVARQAMDLTNTVRVSANTPDPDMSNNFAVTNLSVTSVADVFVTKTDAAANPDAGEQFTYTIEAGNNGPSTAENTVVTDVLPLELEVVSIAVGAVGPPPAGGAGSCATTQSAAGNEVVTCNLGSLLGNLAANTPQRQIAITVRVKEGTPNGTNLFNEVRVSSDEFDDDNRNNIDVEVTPVGQLSDFTLRKVCTPDPVTAGGVLHCGYQITNNGPSTANNVIFQDTWLNGGEFVKLISANVQGHGGADTCYQEDLNGATQVRCSFGDVPVGRTFRLDLEFAVDPSTPDGTSLDNCFVIDADSPVTFNPPANRCESTEVDGVSTVLITKVASDPSPVAGTDYSYKYTVKNNGPSTAFDVTVTDTLPDGLSFVSVNDARCSESGGQVTCNFGDMLPGATITFDIFVRLDADFACGDTLTNNVRVRWDANDDGTLDSESVSVSEVLVDCVSDLRVSKVGKPDNVVDEDELLTYTIVVDNHGPSFADAAAIKDLIAASGQFDVEAVSSDRPATCNSLPAPIGGNPFVPANALNAGTGQTGNLSNLYQLDCTLDDPLGVLAADGPPNSGRWIVQIAVDGDEPGSINNAVTALSGSLDPDQSNNVARTEHEVVASADLSISKTDLPDCDPGDAWPGNFCDMMGNGDTVAIAGSTDDPNDPQGESTFHWRLNVENNGPGDATNVVVTDNLPKEVEVTRIRKEPDQGACTTVQGAQGQQVVTCNLGTIAEGDEVRIDIYVRVPANVSHGTILWNEAWVTSDAFDANNDDNRTRARTDVIAVADLNITKEDDPDPSFAAGGTGTYTLVVNNNGPSVATGVRVEDPLPTGIDGTSVDVVGVTDEVCSISPLPGSSTGREVVRCELGDLDPGASRTIVIAFKVAEDIVPANDANQCVGTSNTATVTSGTKDPDTDDNSATAAQDVCATADLKLTKTSEPEKVNAGEQKRYHIEVENLGPADATGVTVHDVLPDEATYEVDTNGAMCTQPANLIGFRAVLTTANEVPPAPGSGMGLATFVLDTTTNVLEYAVFANDLSSATTSAHIHTGAAGVNGGVLVGLYAGAPPVFDESHPLVGKVTLTGAQAAAIVANPSGHYVNVHTTARAGGEIRGQMARALQTPLECEIGALAAGGKHAFDIFALIDADTMAGTTITNVAMVFADAPPDGELWNNADYSKNYVESKADLRVVKFGKPDAQVRAGDILTYTVIVDNLGPSSAKGVAIKDVLRASGTFDLINIDSDRDMECVSDPNPMGGGGTPADPLVPNNRQSLDIDCTLDGSLGVLAADGFPNPGRWTLTMYVQADETQSINNVVDVLSAALDPNLENNHAIVEHEIQDVSDMAIDKIGPMMAIAGETLTYELVVTNLGPSTSENVVVYDRLPPGIVVTEATVTGGGTCTTGTPANPLDKLECGLGTINVGASKTVRIVATVNPSVPAGTVLENDAFVLSDKFDDDNSNNYDTVLTTVKRAADLVVTKVSERNDVEDASDNAEPAAVAGETIEYTITVTNQGVSDAADVLVVDQLPQGTVYLSANVTVGQGTCLGLPTGEVKCQLGTMVAGATYEIVVRAQVLANYNCAARPNLINVVEATTSSETDPLTLVNNAYTLTTPVECVADVKVEKWSDPIKVYAGEQKKYTVRVTNLGPSDALDVVMEDTLPAEVEYDIDTGGCAVALGEPDVVTCDIGTLPPGGVYEVEIYTTVDPNTAPGTTLVNEAVVTTTTADPDEDNNRDTSENLVLQKADLHVRKFGKPDGQVRAGDVLTYTVIVDNLGPSWANGVALKDVLQSSGDFDLIDILSDREASCRILPAGVVPTNVALGATAWPPDAPPAAFGVTPPTGVSQIENRLEVDCTLADPLAVLAADGPPNSGRWIVTMRVRARMTQDLNNVASTLSEAFDPDRSNNDAFVEHEITDVADLRIIKQQVDEGGTPLPMPMIVAGTTMYYAITVTNGGPSTAENVVVTDRLPAGVTVTSASVVGGGSCTTGAAGAALDKLTCGLGDMTTGSTKVVRVTADVSAWVPEGSVLENDAHVTSDIFDPDNVNNYAHVLTTVKTVADLGVEKYGNPDPIKAGDITSYEIVFRNNGPSVARDVILTDYVPGEFDLLRVYVVDGSPVSDSATCHALTEDPGLADRATCELGDIAPGQGGSVVIVVRVKSDTPAGVYTNTVQIESDTAEPDPDETPNFATFDTTIAPMADLWIEKFSDPVKVNAGEQKKYTVRVTNLGPSDAENVVVTDTLPKEVDYEIDTGLCSVARNSGANGEDVVTCSFGTMKPGQVKTVDIYALVEPQTAPGLFITNRADVKSDTPDGINEANNTAYSRNFVLQKADLKITKFGKMDDRVRAGEVLTYTVIVDNLGPSWASKAAVKDIIQTGGTFDFIDVRSDRAAVCKVLPAGLVPTTVNLAAAAWPVVDPPPAFGVIAGNGVANIEQRLQVDCNLGAPLEALEPNGPPNKGRWILTMRFRARQAQSVNNVASVVNVVPIEGDPSNGSLATDPDPSNNMAMVEHEITDVADLTVTKSASGQVVTGCAADGITPVIANQTNMVTAGLDLTYTLVVTNKGPSDAENVVVYDRLPPGVVLKSGTVDGSATKFANWCATGTPGSPLDKLTCGVGTLFSQPSAGKPNTATIVFTVTVDPALANGAVLENDAYVASDVFDPINQNWANNLTTVKTSADLRLDKTDDHDPVVAGKLLRYTLGVTNDGPSVARDVWTYDDLPADVVYIGSIGAACYEDPVTPGNVACQLGDMAPGEMRFVYLIVQVKPDAAMTLVNTAVAQSGYSDDTPLPAGKLTSDPCPGDNADSESTTVTRETDPFVMKTDLTDPVIAGKPARYQIMFGNNGPSTATKVDVLDVLPDGFMFNRCESIDPNDLVTCTADAAMKTVTLQSIKQKNTVVWTSDKANAANKLDPGESYTFVIVADVSPGYVLDGQTDGAAGKTCEAYAKASDYLFWGWDRATIASLSNVSQKEVDTNPNNNFDDECTRVNAEADLSIAKTDIFGNAATDPGNYFLECDPVEPGGMITYDLTVTNNGMSDAAQVQVVDQLPAQFVVLDPAKVTVTFPDGVGTGQIVEVRDDGKITLLLGNDPFRKGPNAVPAPAKRQLGRINAGSTYRARIQVMVVNPWATMEDKRFVNPMPPYDKICGALLLNTATVSTIKGPAVLPGNVPGWPLKDQTPTKDPDLTNNTDTETTKIECPAIKVEKTVSYDGQCPGSPVPTVFRQGAMVTFCIEITNVGTTYLDQIEIVDTLRTSMGEQVFKKTVTYGKDPKMPVAPGETVMETIMVPPLTDMCGTVSNTVEVTAIPVNSGRTVYPCLSPVAHDDRVEIFVPCSGADFRIQLPALDTGECETWLQVQNVGSAPTVGFLVVWGEAGACPPQAAGPLKVECTGLLKPGSAWTYTTQNLPPGIRSGIMYSLNATNLIQDERGNELPFSDLACDELFFAIVGDHDEWLRFDYAYSSGGRYVLPNRIVLDFGDNQGQPLVVSVNRTCPDPVDPNRNVSAAYVGVGTYLEGAMDPVFGQFAYYAPLVFANKGGLNSWLWIHNSGTRCSSIEIWFKGQDNCLRPILGDVLAVAPGESVHFDPNTVVGPDWIGSAWIRASQPLGIVVDTMGPNHFTSYVGFPSDTYDDAKETTYSIGSQVNYAPLIYSEYQGWDAAIQVQNLSGSTAAKVKVYFLDRSGDVITTVVDWICPRGSQTFFLPVIAGLSGNWVGHARVESQEWWTPGTLQVDPPRIQSVVLLEKWADPARSERREAVAYNALTEQVAFDWQVGKLAGGTQSGSAVLAVPLLAKGNRGVNSELAITNLVTKPGFTDFAIILYDQNALIDFVCQKLHDRQVEYIDLATWGYVPQRFLGSAVISATFWEHEVFDPNGGFQRNLVGLGGVVVERINGTLGAPDVPGDESKAFEAVPIFDFFTPQRKPTCTGQPSFP